MSFLVVSADDYLAGFEHKNEVERYYGEMQKRLSKYGLEIEMSKSRLLEFGRYAKEIRKRRGEGKPETFDFLGFTFYCGENQAEVRRKATIGRDSSRCWSITHWHIPRNTLISMRSTKLQMLL